VQTLALANAVDLPVIASGGVAGLQDLIDLQEASHGTLVQGVIIGRALYDGRIDPIRALTAISA
jgi:phosphoribosylformimino-5-aminoimidazole carboxamide ribotide isomerase